MIALDYLSGYSKNIHECIPHLKTDCHASTRIYILSLNHVWKPLIEIGKSFGWVTEQPQDTNWISRRDLDNILELNGFEVIKSGTQQLFPFSWPLVSCTCNSFFACLPLLRNPGMSNVVIARLLMNRIYVIANLCNRMSKVLGN